MGVEHCVDQEPYQVTKPMQTPNTVDFSAGVRLRGISFVVERETAQIAS